MQSRAVKPREKVALCPRDLAVQRVAEIEAFQRAELAGAEDAWIAVSNPSTGARIGAALDQGAAGIDAAIALAEAAFPGWRRLLARQRAAQMMRWHDAIVAEEEALAALMTLEQGKPLLDALGEIRYAVGFLRWYAEEANRLYGEIIPSHLAGRQLMVKHQPVGIVATVTPWNFPTAMLLRKAAAALAAGCPVVSVPSIVTPFSALALQILAQKAGLEPGVFTVVTGDSRSLVAALCKRPEVRALSFTGSTEVGRKIMSQAAETVKRTSLELGGHAPFIVFEDADLDAAIAGAVAAKFQTGGQDCLAANRIYVARPLYEVFVAGFTRATQALRVGDGFEPGIDIGPLATPQTRAKSQEHVTDALEKGARLLCGGPQTDVQGLFFAPTVLADVTPEMKITWEETFGPVAALMPFDDEAEVIRLANATEYGLVAYAYTRDLARAQALPDLLDYGMVAINTAKLTGPPIPFGGVKQSGTGREGGRLGVFEYTEPQYVCTQTQPF